MVWDTGKSSFDTGQDIWDTGKWSVILVNPVLILVKSIWDTGKWSGILVNPVLILVKTSGILVSGLGYW